MLSVYLIIVMMIFVFILGIFPRIFQSYMIERSEEDLLTTKQIIQETLETGDLTSDAYMRDKLDAVARAKGIEIWICLEPESKLDGSIMIPTIRLGGSRDSQDLQLTSQSSAFIETIRSGRDDESMYMDQFPEYYSQKTLTLAYSTPYIERQPLMGNMYMTQDAVAVVLLNISLEGISQSVQTTMFIILITFTLISIVVAIMILSLANSIVTPVNQMREIAAAITQGDFSQKVEIHSRDEIADLAQTFNLMATELQEVEATQQAFIANISHDFRSPLTSIRGFVQAMLDDVIPPDQYDKYLQIVFNETNRLSKLANDLLLLTRMESGQDELHVSRFDINEMILKLTLGFEQRAEEKKLQIEFKFLQEKLYVNADMDKLQRVIYNLVDNAIKFTGEGDSITVETSIVNKKAFIAVADTGIGMDEESMRHIFERFHKGDKSRGLNKTGMGLGLAIVKQIIVNHGEGIQVYSKEGEGTRFEFTLPLANQVSFVEKK
ncbi:MAG: HAMP domain-containing histidine kinase [Firmicutes bacterium]|nr:HAMP domain-containing histidine kinase [Bacillota bacterium]